MEYNTNDVTRVLLIFFIFVLCFFSNFAVTQAQWTVDDDGCRTPDRGVGSCIQIKDCRPIIELLESASKPLSTRVRQLLRRYQCGSENGKVKVCCPSSTTNVFVVNPGVQNVEPIPDVSRHRKQYLLPRDCGSMDSEIRITHGDKTALFEFPWMALLSYRTVRGPEFKCGGTIINNRYILTAAHCVKNLKSPIIGIRVGEHDISKRVDCETFRNKTTCAPKLQDLAIERVVPHSNFNTTSLIDDIALIRVSSRIDFSKENAKPVCLPLEETGNYNFTNRNVIVTGWGFTETGKRSDDLLKVKLPVVPLEECRRLYENVATITHHQLCAGGGKDQKDSCGGDSGGPLQVAASLGDEVRYVQQGIVSFGPKNCGSGSLPGIYTRIAYYLPWILDNIYE